MCSATAPAAWWQRTRTGSAGEARAARSRSSTPSWCSPACARFGVAVEINSRPERLDPPRRLIDLAVEAGCRFSIDSDAHAPGQLDWQPFGCVRAVEQGLTPDQIVNTWDLDTLLEWTRRHD